MDDEQELFLERCFCLALMSEGVDTIHRIIVRYVHYRDGATLSPEECKLLGLAGPDDTLTEADVRNWMYSLTDKYPSISEAAELLESYLGLDVVDCDSPSGKSEKLEATEAAATAWLARFRRKA